MRYHQFLRNTLYWRYIIFFATLFFALYWVQAYLNRQNMLVSIQDIKDEIVDIEEEVAFIENFERPFLESERAPYYLGHENGVLYNGERVVRLRDRAPVVADEDTPDDVLALQQVEEDKIKISSPEESRHYFINDKLKPLKDIWLLE